jgi:acetamidase/formamidase
MGDGEICGTAIESPMDAEPKNDLLKGANLPFPRLETDGPVTNHIDDKGYRVTTGIGDDLMQASCDAVGGMIDWICATTQMLAVDAYMLCSVACDLRISEIVGVLNCVVSFYFPKSVLG